MKHVVWVDTEGKKHRSIVRDGDSSEAGEAGLPHDPPDLRQLDWDEIVLELHNKLVDRGLSTLDDVRAMQNGVSSVIQGVIRHRIMGLYREDANK